ncbi:MAG: cupredoxin domain-containing protein [Candidatus Pacebacteria bacterium]|jgi:plastocyanin|nr:hypothetical protein [Parcubacteria group bacterium]MDP6249432.1 cupredoxin domain-containing protein [Candidatus Paceibacterota bacterium]MDP7159586.1 cupredoxin domain-containing protein [Candidatus Paceibacterota bacterium]MDP7366305.1 cupredoxin domain-containing protein [Candidatus Paceibacterota bacterium]MDP7466194.1 cupredoxin domain-containing protein [Candidatus Paceibacterota bacterium]|tara:strand:+ start:11156 stop:11608 length:453 start_codon:yes stop_codon:yes gene_type:complete
MKGIITIIIIIIIIAVGFFLLQDGTTEDAGTVTNEMTTEETGDTADMIVEDEDTALDTTAEVIVVTYTSSAFSPKDIAVSAGQTVRFVNESSGNMWVASDEHPTHTVLPEFDNKESVGNGENYEFVFTETGEWNYHNHVNPSAVGTVTVE